MSSICIHHNIETKFLVKIMFLSFNKINNKKFTMYTLEKKAEK